MDTYLILFTLSDPEVDGGLTALVDTDGVSTFNERLGLSSIIIMAVEVRLHMTLIHWSLGFD